MYVCMYVCMYWHSRAIHSQRGDYCSGGLVVTKLPESATWRFFKPVNVSHFTFHLRPTFRVQRSNVTEVNPRFVLFVVNILDLIRARAMILPSLCFCRRDCSKIYPIWHEKVNLKFEVRSGQMVKIMYINSDWFEDYNDTTCIFVASPIQDYSQKRISPIDL